MIEILEQIGVAFLGAFIYTLIAFRKYISTKEARTLVFWQSLWIESRIMYMYTFVMIVVLSVTIKALPDAGETIMNLSGFDVKGNLMSFFSLGFAILAGLDSKKH